MKIRQKMSCFYFLNVALVGKGHVISCIDECYSLR